MNLNITYSSGLKPSYAVLTMLAIFYDKIYLPHPYGVSGDSRKIWHNWGGDFDIYLSMIQSEYASWKEDNALYFKENVIETLPDMFDAPSRITNVADQIKKRLGLSSLNSFDFTVDQLLDRQVRFHNSSIYSGTLALALHFTYSERKNPDYMWANDLANMFGVEQEKWGHLITEEKTIKDFSTDNLRKYLYTALAKELELPIFKPMNIYDILELRHKFSEGRAALADTMNTYINSLEELISNGNEPDTAALKIIEREYSGKFREFKRKLEFEKTGRWARFLGGFAKIDANFWTPKFYMQVASTLLSTLESESEFQLKNSTNETLGFRYLAKVTRL